MIDQTEFQKGFRAGYDEAIRVSQAVFGETVIGADGLSRPITLREVVARAVLKVLRKPDGVETLDWQIADSVIVTLFSDIPETLQK